MTTPVALPFPSAWDRVPAKRLVERQRRPPRPSDDIVTAFRDGQVTLRANRRMEGFTNAVQEVGYQGIRRGDLVIHGMDGFAGAIGVSDSDGKASPVVHAYSPRRDVDARYYAYLLRVLAQSGFITSLAKGIRERSTAFDAESFGSLELPSPPIATQRAIAAYLGTETARIDSLVAAKQRMVELLEERWLGTIHEATRGAHTPGPRRDSGVDWLGSVPSAWRVMSIKRLGRVHRGASPRPIDDPVYFDPDGEFAWVRISDVSASTIYLNRTTQRLSVLGSSLSVKLMPGDLFLSIAGTVGKPIIAQVKCCIHDGFVYFPEIKMLPKYLYYLFAAGRLYLGLGKLGTQLNLNTDTVGAIRVPVPEPAEQAAIVTGLDQAGERFRALHHVLDTEMVLIRERRQALITAAVTGQLNIPDAA